MTKETSVFSFMVNEIEKMKVAKHPKTITKNEYEQWKNEYIFARIKGQRYGQYFCNYFGITDNILYYDDNREIAETYLLKHYVQ